MAAFRAKQGKKTLPTRVLLRDMLYLLQGIDGKHVRFARKTQAQRNREANPYIDEPDFANGPGRGAAAGKKNKGKGKATESDGIDYAIQQMEADEITGLAYFLDAEDGQVGTRPCFVEPV